MIKRILLSIVLVAAMLLPAVAFASPVPGGPWAGSWDVQTRTKWGGTSAESTLATPANPLPAGVQLNPYPAPVWVVGSYYPFEFTYTRATGVTTWKIDFNIDGDFADPSESASSTSPTLIGYGFRYLNLWMSGSAIAPGTVDVQNFTVNGTNLGGFTSNPDTTPIEWTWTDSSGYFGDVTVTGQYRMSAAGSAGESNRMWIRLGDPVPPPNLSVTTADSLICTGESTTVSIDLANIVGLWGYQFEVSYDQTMASAAGAFVNSFFDTTGAIVQWNADCASTPGTCKFAVAKQQTVPPAPPVSPVSGTGPLAQITLTGVAPGAFNMTISNDVLSDVDGIALAHNVGAPLPITVCGLATVSGKITLQGRPGNNVDVGTVSMVEQAPTNFTPVAPVNFSAVDGAYSITVPYMPGGSSYKIVAEHGLYLDNEDTITVSGDLANKNTRLWGGDADNGGKVGIADLACIGGDFGSAPPISTCGGTGSPDINADNKVNIQDLSLAGGNYDKCSPEPWDWISGLPNTTCPGAS